MKPALLIVDDDEEIRTQMKWGLSEDYNIVQAADRKTAIERFRVHKPLVVLLDLGLPPHANSTTEGMESLAELLEIEPRTKVIIASGQGEREVTIRAVGAGAYDFLNKPVDMDELTLLLKRSFYVAKLERDYAQLHRDSQIEAFHGMIGSSKPMQAVFETIRKVSSSKASVMILGESGTGKEVAAQAIHQLSDRKDKPFVAINCSAIPENLIESELFGHEKGSFTGAEARHIGKIEQAQKGTLFLDEIGEVPLQTQVKLLRFLQEGTIERVGGKETLQVDARILAATNADLKKGMADGTFREDFYFRLVVIELKLPPLRDREDDLRVIGTALLNKFARENGKEGLTFSRTCLSALHQHAWTGNVRELQNRIQRAVIMCSGKSISPVDLELENASNIRLGPSLKEARDNLEKEMIELALKKHDGLISAAAKELSIGRPTLYDLMNKHEIERKP
ncbi:MAG: PEP-CTERM-box response regulator transcription factor [Pirellulales bacterium]|nr:PEP-CTERM-box response regulator transcription factor [Pirellulales bacterium]